MPSVASIDRGGESSLLLRADDVAEASYQVAHDCIGRDHRMHESKSQLYHPDCAPRKDSAGFENQNDGVPRTVASASQTGTKMTADGSTLVTKTVRTLPVSNRERLRSL